MFRIHLSVTLIAVLFLIQSFDCQPAKRQKRKQKTVSTRTETEEDSDLKNVKFSPASGVQKRNSVQPSFVSQTNSQKKPNLMNKMAGKNRSPQYLTQGGTGLNGKMLNNKNMYASVDPEDASLNDKPVGKSGEFKDKLGNTIKSGDIVDRNGNVVKNGDIIDEKGDVVGQVGGDTKSDESSGENAEESMGRENLKDAAAIRKAKVPVASSSL